MRPRDFTRKDAGLLGCSGLAGVAVVWLVFDQLTLLSGGLGFFVCAYVASLLIYWSVAALVEGRLAAKDRVITVVMWSAAVLLFAALALILGFVVLKGIQYISLHFFVADDKNVGPLSPAGSAGGLHAIVGTLEQNALAVAIGAPAAIITAVFLNEVRGRLTWLVRTVVTAMSGVPSIVAGVFIYSIWIVRLHNGFSGLAAALSLAILLLPTVTRTTEEVLRLVPGGLREAALATGAPEWRTAWSVVLPTARSGVITAVVLGAALTVGETAPLIFTSFGSSVTNPNPLHGPQAALPLLAYNQIRLPIKSQIALGYTAALSLLIVVGVLFVITRILGGSAVGRSRRRRSERRSAAAQPGEEGAS